MPLEQQLLLALQTCALLGLTIRLWWTGLFRAYPFFFGYLLVCLLQSVVLPPLPYRSLAYRNAWLATEGLVVSAQVLVVLELSKVLLRGLPGITTVARRYIRWTVALAIAGSVVLLRVERAPVSVVGYFLACERSIVSSVVIFVLLTMLFLVYYPVPLNRNVIAYSIGYTVYFLTKAAAIFLRNLTPTWYREVSTVLLIISTACLIFWLFTLTRRGETRAMVVGPQWSPATEEQLLSKLRAINAGLIRTVRT